MAYAALASFAQTIDLILNHHQDSISPLVKNRIIYIYEYVIFLQAFLEDFPDKANSFEGRIREVTHAAEDIIELFMLEQIHESSYALLESSVGPSKSKFNHQPKGKYEHPCYDFHELEKVTKEIESIAEKVMEIKDNIIVKDVRLGYSAAASSSSGVAPVHKDVLVGLDDDLMEIKCRLCGDSSKLEVIPIVGMGGIGKTTLARNAYDDLLTVEHFDIRAWVTVSQDYSVQGIVSGLLASMKGLGAKNDSMKEHNVYQNLKSRRYLIVLDDIWSIKAWDDLMMMFPDDGNGSRIMLTTRLSDVASYPDSHAPVHEMHLLDEDQSWDLLRQKVFKQDPCPHAESECVGKMIARRCNGLPLAIVVISGLLAVDQTIGAWWKIADDIYSAMSANDEQFDKILSLSYTNLPHYLRPCFLYMGGFPYQVRVSTLIKLWVAEGFLKPNGCNKSLEETGEEYLEDLVKRNLVLVTKRKCNGRIKSLSMHDVLREMCIRKSKEEDFILLVFGLLREGIKIPRRLSIFYFDMTVSHFCLDSLKSCYASTIRTIIHLNENYLSGTCSLRDFRLLRILHLSDGHEFTCTYNGSDVFELFHLRYLALEGLSRIPAAISNLQNLQTLIIGRPSKYYEITPTFVELPVEIWRMRQLRHLVFCSPLPHIPAGVRFALEYLQTLSIAINFICSEEILEMIPNLKKLGISYMRSGDMYEEDYQLHNLIYLQQLENLKLKMAHNFPFREKVNPVFPRTLKKLTLSGLRLPWEDLSTVGSLPNLQVLKLRKRACVGRRWETTEGEFSELKFLLIHRSHLQHWITESSHFPRLKCLVLRRCRYLSEIPDGIGEIPTIELIDVNYNGESLLDSAKQIQDYQQSCGNDALQVMAHLRWFDE